MAQKIAATLADPALRAALVRRGFERIQAMSVETYAASLAQLLDELPGKQSQGKRTFRAQL